MARHLWYKRDGAAFIGETMGLSLEEKGAYSLCLDLIYSQGGPIQDDARWLAGVCGISVRKWALLRARLIATGKLFLEGGKLMNARAAIEIEQFAASRVFPLRPHAPVAARPAVSHDDNSRENQAARSNNNGLESANPETAAPEKREEKEKTLSSDPPLADADAGVRGHGQARRNYPEGFEAFWKAYPTDPIMSKLKAFEKWQRLAAPDRAAAMAAIPAFRAHCAKHPDYRPLHAERFLSQRRFDGLAAAAAPPADEAGAKAAWDGRAARLVEEIGAVKFLAWFGEADFTPGPPAVITVKRKFQKNWIANNYEAPLRRAFGEFELRSAA
ncbi:MAG TPA: YdaU family protein [Rhizomicrobium sp.]|nr:YdaU family protein [Rhizomicrobium sp.]